MKWVTNIDNQSNNEIIINKPENALSELSNDVSKSFDLNLDERDSFLKTNSNSQDDVIIENANFNFNNTNYNFFIRVLNNKFSKINFEIKKSNVFFRNRDI